MKALILAAGIGRRLKISIPKIMLKIGNKTLLERHLNNLIEYYFPPIIESNYL